MKNKNLTLLFTLLLTLLLLITLSGCESRESNMVSYNLSLEADNFNIVRQLTVVSLYTNDVIFQMTGNLSINVDGADDQLEIVVEVGDGKYRKHFVGLGDMMCYTVEDLGNTNVDKYNYILNYNPKMWLPIDIETVD